MTSLFRRSSTYAFTLIAVTLALLTLGGCSGVTTREIIGEPSAKTGKAMEGTWQVGTAVFQIKDTGDGKISMATTDWKNNQWEVTTMHCIVTTLNDQTLIHLPASVLTKDETGQHKYGGKPEEYIFARLLFYGEEPGTVVIYRPDLNVFRQAVEEQTLKGTVISEGKGKMDKTKIRLQSTAKEIAEFMTSEDYPAPKFSSEDPLVYVRIK